MRMYQKKFVEIDGFWFFYRHQDLMAANGVYASMWNEQLRNDSNANVVAGAEEPVAGEQQSNNVNSNEEAQAEQ